MEDRQVKVYLTRTEDIDVTKEARRQFADWVGADLYLEIGLSSDPENTSVYGISGEYNDEYYIPESATFSGPIALQGRLRWRPAIGQWDFSQQQRKMSCGRSQSRQPESLWGIVTNAAERQLLIQEDYPKKACTRYCGSY